MNDLKDDGIMYIDDPMPKMNRADRRKQAKQMKKFYKSILKRTKNSKAKTTIYKSRLNTKNLTELEKDSKDENRDNT